MSIMKSKTGSKVAKFVSSELASLADKQKAPEMAAYMKTDMPFYGVQKPQREPIARELKRLYRPASLEEYEEVVRELWQLPHREEKYIALDYATTFIALARPETLGLYEDLVRDGQWWDFVDVVAGHLVGILLLNYREQIEPTLDQWIADDDFWIRRTAILSQLKHKKATDADKLFEYCQRCMGEKEFFIRKAIGWALREYSYHNPEAVKKFLHEQEKDLSGLSYREGAKRLKKLGLIK